MKSKERDIERNGEQIESRFTNYMVLIITLNRARNVLQMLNDDEASQSKSKTSVNRVVRVFNYNQRITDVKLFPHLKSSRLISNLSESFRVLDNVIFASFDIIRSRRRTTTLRNSLRLGIRLLLPLSSRTKSSYTRWVM